MEARDASLSTPQGEGVTHAQTLADAKRDERSHSYHLTDKGESLRPVLLALRDWGLEWIPGTEAKRA